MVITSRCGSSRRTTVVVTLRKGFESLSPLLLRRSIALNYSNQTSQDETRLRSRRISLHSSFTQWARESSETKAIFGAPVKRHGTEQKKRFETVAITRLESAARR